MDGIPVKISERYKPPKKITLPGVLINRLNSEVKFEEYDFSLEKTVVEQLEKLKELRKNKEEERKQKLERQDLQETTKRHQFQTTEPPVNQNPILTPVPITSRIVAKKEAPTGPINFSDFESDTSSPFDNMELKTINDLEELAHVLGTNHPENTVKYVHPPNGMTHYNVHWNGPHVGTGWSEASMPLPSCSVQSPSMPVSHPQTPQTSTCQQYPTIREFPDQTVPNILQSLSNSLHERRVTMAAAQTPQPSTRLSPTSGIVKGVNRLNIETKPSTLPNPISQLSFQCRQLAHKVAEMGFPLARVARAVSLFGEDEARVIEFLLQIQKLAEKLNIPGDRAERALVANSYSEENAIRYLDDLTQLMGLGFREEQVVQALVRFNSDRDKALDFLIS